MCGSAGHAIPECNKTITPPNHRLIPPHASTARACPLPPRHRPHLVREADLMRRAHGNGIHTPSATTDYHGCLFQPFDKRCYSRQIAIATRTNNRQFPHPPPTFLQTPSTNTQKHPFLNPTTISQPTSNFLHPPTPTISTTTTPTSPLTITSSPNNFPPPTNFPHHTQPSSSHLTNPPTTNQLLIHHLLTHKTHTHTRNRAQYAFLCVCVFHRMPGVQGGGP